jgi:hypothetical protein
MGNLCAGARLPVGPCTGGGRRKCTNTQYRTFEFMGNLDAARSAAAVRPGTTRKVGVRDAWQAKP